MSNVTSIAKHSQDGRKWSLKDMLEDALEETDNKMTKKALLIYLDDTDDSFSVGFSQCGMTTMEILMLCELAKDRVKMLLYNDE